VSKLTTGAKSFFHFANPTIPIGPVASPSHDRSWFGFIGTFLPMNLICQAAIMMPKEVGCLNLLIFEDFLRIKISKKTKLRPFLSHRINIY